MQKAVKNLEKKSFFCEKPKICKTRAFCGFKFIQVVVQNSIGVAQKCKTPCSSKIEAERFEKSMASTGIEPATFALLARRSNQLS